MPREGVAVPVPNILGFIVFYRVIMGDKRRHKKTLASFGIQGFSLLVEEDGFEPSKSTTTDLQSDNRCLHPLCANGFGSNYNQIPMQYPNIFYLRPYYHGYF